MSLTRTIPAEGRPGGAELKKRRIALIGLASLLLLSSCGGQDTPAEGMRDGEGAERSYRQISQEEAAQLIERESGYVILDVRTAEEFAAGHIPGAVNLPNEDIGGERPAELPDTKQLILVYCRTGRRSKEASQKLLELGYDNVAEFGGIVTWPGEIVTGTP